MARQQLLTRDEFDAFVTTNRIPIYVRPPYDVVPCRCGDINCHGWRFVELSGINAAIDDLREAVYV